MTAWLTRHAQTLIGLGVDLSEIVTSSSLQVGIATAFSKQ